MNSSRSYIQSSMDCDKIHRNMFDKHATEQLYEYRKRIIYFQASDLGYRKKKQLIGLPRPLFTQLRNIEPTSHVNFYKRQVYTKINKLKHPFYLHAPVFN